MSGFDLVKRKKKKNLSAKIPTCGCSVMRDGQQGRERTLDDKCSSPEVRDSSSEQHFCLEKSIGPICEKNLFGEKRRRYDRTF